MTIGTINVALARLIIMPAAFPRGGRIEKASVPDGVLLTEIAILHQKAQFLMPTTRISFCELLRASVCSTGVANARLRAYPFFGKPLSTSLP